jgi:hypothetical protein
LDLDQLTDEVQSRYRSPVDGDEARRAVAHQGRHHRGERLALEALTSAKGHPAGLMDA